MGRLFSAIVFVGALSMEALAGGVLRPAGWWVVLGSFANPSLSAIHDRGIRSLRGRVARCGFDAFNDFSNKFGGFAPGYDVVAVGAYKTSEAARADLQRVRVCVPGAYIKFGEHLGE